MLPDAVKPLAEPSKSCVSMPNSTFSVAVPFGRLLSLLVKEAFIYQNSHTDEYIVLNKVIRPPNNARTIKIFSYNQMGQYGEPFALSYRAYCGAFQNLYCLSDQVFG